MTVQRCNACGVEIRPPRISCELVFRAKDITHTFLIFPVTGNNDIHYCLGCYAQFVKGGEIK